MEVESLGKMNYDKKVQLLSLLVRDPKQWVMKLIDGVVGSASLQDAKLAAKLVDAGVKFVVCDDTHCNHHFGPKEDFLIDWFKHKDNTFHSPEVNKTKAGKHKSEPVMY